ncbi:hypothetical protein [uncultured Neisseria sp.]|uniref:hypothetical protein n=1 Tax=uncultured Neisseria sp. TaxID=237778 RepID=UPI0028047448|nr:hypothetical protein [uncultured Neisseria sp.]
MITTSWLNYFHDGLVKNDKFWKVIMSEENAKVAGSVSGVGTAAGIGTAASTMSASAITGTLATIGGGSMAVGIGIVAAAPLAVGAITYGLYSLFDD